MSDPELPGDFAEMEMDSLFTPSSPIWACGDVKSPLLEEMFSSNPTVGTLGLSPFDLEAQRELKAEAFKTSPQLEGSFGSDCEISPMPFTGTYPHCQSQQFFSQNCYSPNYGLDSPFVAPGNCGSSAHTLSHSTFPSMSVNVSMNMTMGYLAADSGQVSPQSSSNHARNFNCCVGHWPSHSGHHQGNCSYGPSTPPPNFPHQPYSTTYSFAADFRSEPTLETIRSQWIPSLHGAATTSPNSRSYCQSKRKWPGSVELESERGDPKENLCRICGKSYARPSTLKTHLRTHSGEKPFRCMECQKSFSQAANLTAHVRTHSGEKPFGCPICDRRFSQSSSVTTHMRTHSGERPYRCRLCKKAFSDSSTLTKHLRIHSGEKPYECKLCLLRFSQSGNLNRHMRVHSGTNQ